MFRKKNEGMSLLEVVVALSLMSIFIMSLFAMQLSGARINTLVREEQKIMAQTQNFVEILSSVPFSSGALFADAATANTKISEIFDADHQYVVGSDTAYSLKQIADGIDKMRLASHANYQPIATYGSSTVLGGFKTKVGKSTFVIVATNNLDTTTFARVTSANYNSAITAYLYLFEVYVQRGTSYQLVLRSYRTELP